MGVNAHGHCLAPARLVFQGPHPRIPVTAQRTSCERPTRTVPCIHGKVGEAHRSNRRGRSDADIAFDELVNLLLHFGFETRTRGSHHVFRKAGVSEKVNLQKDGSKAKPYQVRQVRNLIVQHRLGGNG